MMMFFLEKNMKKWKIGISVMLVLCIFMLTACGSKKSVDNKSTQNAGDCITVSIPESFESLSGMNADNLMDYLKTNGDGNYEELKIADGLVQKFLNKWTIFLFCSILFSSNQKEH